MDIFRVCVRIIHWDKGHGWLCGSASGDGSETLKMHHGATNRFLVVIEYQLSIWNTGWVVFIVGIDTS